MADSQRKTANLFDLTTNRTSYSCSVSIDNNGNVTQTNSGSYARSEWTFENLEANKYYTLKVKYSNPNSNSVRLNILNSNAQTIITSDVETDISGDLSVTFQAQGGNTFIRLYSNTLSTVTFTAVVFFDIMLNEGETALPYEPYSSTGWYHSLRKLTTATEAVENPLYTDGTAITSYTIKGNTVQNGTPTPSNPVEVNGVGVRTENLFDKDDAIMNKEINGYSYQTNNDYYITNFIPVTSGETYSKSADIGTSLLLYHNADFNETVTQKISLAGDGSFTIPEGYNYIVGNGRKSLINSAKINKGSTLLPYEPYGYKIPIPNGQQTTNIYLGSTASNRVIYKVIFDGTEDWTESPNTWGYRFRITLTPTALQSDTSVGAKSVCTHFKLTSNGGTYSIKNAYTISGTSEINISLDENYRLSDFKAYLAAQYAAGTPVTVWYVLATPTTGIVNEPLMKIGDYSDSISNAISIPTTEGANSISVGTTVQPSEFTATWTGWHNATVKEKSENLFDKSLNEVYPNSTLGNVNEWSYGSGSTGTVVRMACKPNTTYTLSISNSVSTTVFRISIIDSDETPISGQTGGMQCTTLVSDGSLRQATITTTSGTKYILFQPQTAAVQDAVDSLMLNEGQTALPYEPYWE